MTYEVNEPILNFPFEEPSQYWYIRKEYEPELHEALDEIMNEVM
jgi:type III restriction enzyme